MESREYDPAGLDEGKGTMVLEWLGGSKDADALIARGKYKQAVEALRDLLQRHGSDPRLRMKLADALALAGREREAVPVLLDLADDFAAEGQAAKSIALLKKVQKIDPGRAEVVVKLADLIKTKERRQRGWDPQGEKAAGYEPPSWAASTFAPDHFAGPRVYTPEERIAAARGASWVPSTRQEEASAPPSPAASGAAAPLPAEEPITVEEMEIQILDVIQDALQRPAAPAPKAAPASGADAPTFVDSPLFSGFSRDELVAVIRGLRLLTFEPGDIVLTEGDRGDSLFVITGGTVKTFVRDTAQGGQMLMRRLKEGEFFGEISVLSGKARSATVTAATRCEMLELDRATLDQITTSYPHVRQVLEEFYLARAEHRGEPFPRSARLITGPRGRAALLPTARGRAPALARRPAAPGLPRQGGPGGGAVGLPLERARGGPRSRRRRLPAALCPALAQVAPGLLLRGPLPTRGRRERHARAARLGQPDRDGLLGRPRPVFALPHVVDLLTHELAGLGAGSLAFLAILFGPLERFLLWH